MGHYLSDFESDEAYRIRTVYGPMRDRLDVYDAEVRRGLMHTEQYHEEMRQARETLREKGWDV